MEFGIFAAGLTCLALGGVMILFAGHIFLQERRRESARTALLANLAFPEGKPAEPITDEVERFGVDEFRRETSVAAEPLFSEPAASGAASRRAMALAAVAVGFAVVVGTYWWFARAGSHPAVATTAAPASDAVASATTVSLPVPIQTSPRVELLSLTHRATPAAFVVTGQVHNPADGAPLRGVVAVVEVMDDAGRVLMTVRAPLTRPDLGAGEDAEFSASASKATHVAQYRVKFQDPERVVIPQVDRRQKVTSHV